MSFTILQNHLIPYDRVNSFLRMNNYQRFISSKAEEYTYVFNEDGLAQIKDVP